MKYKSVFLFLVFIFFAQWLFSWGFFAHKKINRMAVFTLPTAMIGFYKYNIDYISENAVNPDKRRYTVKEEAPKHYIDLDHYGLHPFDSIPQKWKKAVDKYSEDTLMAYGIVPWQIEKQVYLLTKAFKERDGDKILRYSAELGHYVADAHVPLHTTENYNGQLTNQKGIHGFWESRIPEMFSENYDYLVGKAIYIEDPLELAWQAVKASNAAKDSVLLFEAALNSSFPTDQKYSLVKKGNRNVKDYSDEYTIAYNNKLNGMVERRMRACIHAIGSLWYTAWINAGEPDLNILYNKELTNTAKVTNETVNFEELKINGSVEGHEDE